MEFEQNNFENMLKIQNLDVDATTKSKFVDLK